MSVGEILKVLTECSSDNLFVLTGLAFTALAVVGNVWLIQPGKGGRIASAAVGPILLVAGLWMHAHQHITQMRVMRVDFHAASNVYEGPCPFKFEFPGHIETSGPGTVFYEVEFSDGSKTKALPLEFAGPETQEIKAVWKIQQSHADAWAQLRILAPGSSESEKVSVTATCQESGPPKPSQARQGNKPKAPVEVAAAEDR
ncbi:MAG TPA: hypothetical protein VNB54_01685 [Alphaproteobacteria bacterium]|nr:hypothetical protein [Alphaproteobacteria bacterium]